MNKNTKRRQAAHRKACIANGRRFPTKGFKKKAQPFPRPNALWEST